MKVAKWGNSLAVRLPADLVEKLGLSEGDDINIVADDTGLTIARAPDRLDLLVEARKYRGLRPKDYRYSRDENVARGGFHED
jgi:antitoxin MazE